jgi:hypothetical protein
MKRAPVGMTGALVSNRFFMVDGRDARPTTGRLSYDAFLTGFMSVKAMIMPMTASPAVG